MLVVRSGPRNVQHAVYVGVEHWRQLHLHSWPCDRNRNKGSIICSSQQQCRTVRHGFVFGCVCVCVCAREITKRRISRLSSRCSPRRWAGRSIETECQLVRPAEHPYPHRAQYCVLCEPEKNQGIAFFSRQALIRVLIVGDHASKLRLTSLAVIRANLVTEIWTSRCLVMEPCEPPSTHKIVHCSPEARVEE